MADQDRSVAELYGGVIGRNSATVSERRKARAEDHDVQCELSELLRFGEQAERDVGIWRTVSQIVGNRRSVAATIGARGVPC